MANLANPMIGSDFICCSYRTVTSESIQVQAISVSSEDCGNHGDLMGPVNKVSYDNPPSYLHLQTIDELDLNILS
jgi:hypothetical protein